MQASDRVCVWEREAGVGAEDIRGGADWWLGSALFGVSGPLGPIYPIWEACWVSGRNFEDKSCTDCNGDNTNK